MFPTTCDQCGNIIGTFPGHTRFMNTYTFSVENRYICSTSMGFLFDYIHNFVLNYEPMHHVRSLYAKFFFITSKFFFITCAMQNKSQSKLGRSDVRMGREVVVK